MKTIQRLLAVIAIKVVIKVIKGGTIQTLQISFKKKVKINMYFNLNLALLIKNQ